MRWHRTSEPLPRAARRTCVRSVGVRGGLLAAYVAKTDTSRSTYGPLTSVLALLVWANLTAVARLFGVAFCAQVEAVRAGAPEPTTGDDHAAADVIPPPRSGIRGGVTVAAGSPLIGRERESGA
jgi:hypothetical protein